MSDHLEAAIASIREVDKCLALVDPMRGVGKSIGALYGAVGALRDAVNHLAAAEQINERSD